MLAELWSESQTQKGKIWAILGIVLDAILSHTTVHLSPIWQMLNSK